MTNHSHSERTLYYICLAAFVLLLGRHLQQGSRSTTFSGSEDVAVSVDINTADWVELSDLKGVGSSLAYRIVADRQIHGSYSSPDDLVRVPGVSQRIVEENRDRIHTSP